ncbi:MULTISPECIES: fibronectin type III domain-containing protein [Paenibacillus]|uniref:fibronectin type III domain-containing protein n=1 Tax=Paenibacillus TaxID=44249 RepID=UPI0022B891B0|nr:dockerin type I domain-containing protein [Paenibacillus caseinilyticus]MCZ8521116.1 dockerin type I domain-containing protein [Paenibacillus caseinilyticus]
MSKTLIALWMGCMLSLLLAIGVQAEGPVMIRIDSPYPNTSYDRVLGIRASTYSEIEAVRAVAKVEDREAELVYSCVGECGWRGEIALEGLTKGAKRLTIEVTDELGGISTEEAPFYYNSAPVLTRVEPAHEAVVTDGKLHAVAAAEDDSSVPEIRVRVTGDFNTIADFSGKGSIDQVIDVSDYAGQQLKYYVTAKDDQGAESDSLWHTVHVTSDPRNIPVDTASGRIVDFDRERYLLERSGPHGYALVIKDRKDGTESLVADRAEFNNRMQLTPTGALFIQSPGTSNFVHYWTKGELTKAPYSMRSKFGIKGNYALFDHKGAPTPFVLYDTSIPGTPAETITESFDGFELTDDGGFYFVQGDTIFRHPLKGASEAYVSGDEGKGIRGLAASGSRLLFQQGQELYAYDGSQVALISGGLDVRAAAHEDYELNGGWIAYIAADEEGTGLFLRSPEGAVTRVATVNGSPSIGRLEADGSLSYASGSRVYLYQPGNEAPVSAGTAELDSIKLLDGAWYKTIGNSLFRFQTARPDAEGPVWPGGQALTVTGVTYSSAVLQWLPASDGTGVASYHVYRDGEPLASVAGDVYGYVDDSLAPATTYEFTVEAWDAAGNKSKANPAVTVTTSAYQSGDRQAPVWPAGSALTVTDVTYNRAQLSWPAAEDDTAVTSYLIYRDGQLLDTVDGSVYGYAASGLQAGTAYRFSVAAGDAAGNVSETPLASTVTTGTGEPVPSAKLSLQAKPGFLDTGSVLEVNVQGDAADLYAFLAKLTYDPAKFKLMQVKLQDSFGRENDTAVLAKSSPAANQANITGTLLGDVPGKNGKVGLLTLKFTVLAQGTGTFFLQPGSTLSDSQGRIVRLDNPVQLAVQVSGADLDQDGIVGLSDLVLISKHSGTKAGQPGYEARFDLNNSGAVDSADVLYIANAVASSAK